VAPNKTEVVDLPKDKKAISINLPEAYHNSNVMIDVKAKGIRKSTVFPAPPFLFSFLKISKYKKFIKKIY
jgi:hypothetical protein